MAGRIEVLTGLLEPVIAALGYQLWGIVYLGRGKQSVLRVYLDEEGGIDVEDCALASRHIGSLLDVEDVISGEYTLEVSSPGLDRPLFSIEQFRACAGQRARVRLTESFEGRRKFSGLIKGVENDEVILIAGDEQYILPFELIEKANIVPAV